MMTLASVLASSAAFAAIAPDSKVIVLDSGEAKLTLIDEAARKVVGTQPTGKEPHHLMITPDAVRSSSQIPCRMI